jgi:hypothetical protein
MSHRHQRILWGLLMVPASALLGFLVGGHLAAVMADSGSALADGATAALAGFAAAALAAGAAGWSVARHRLQRLPLITLSLLLLAGAGTWLTWSRNARRRSERTTLAETTPRPRNPTPTVTSPILDRGVIAPVTDSIVGLLTIDGVDEPIGQLRPALELRAAPRTSSAILFVAQRFDELEYRELGYEQPAAVVRGIAGDWLLLVVADGASGWTLPPEGSAFTTFEALIVDRLNYLTAAWDRRVAATPSPLLRHHEGSATGRRVTLHRLRWTCRGTTQPAGRNGRGRSELGERGMRCPAHPSATSSTIITVKPAIAPTVERSVPPCLWAAGINSSITTKIIAPAAKASA